MLCCKQKNKATCPPGKRGLPGQNGASGIPGNPGLPGTPGSQGPSLFPDLVTSFIEGVHGGETVTNNYTFPFSAQNPFTPDTTWATFDSTNFAWILQPGTYSITFFVPLRVIATTTMGVPLGSYVNLVDRISGNEIGLRQNVGPVISNDISTVSCNSQVYYKYPLTITAIQGPLAVVVRFFTTNVNNNITIIPGLPLTSERGTWTVERLLV